MSIGYDNLDINHNIVLDLPFDEGIGTIASGRSKNHYSFTLTGAPAAYVIPASGLNVLDFTAGTPDFLEAAIADVGDLDFTNEDFSLNFWINPDTLVGDLEILCHGLDATDGYDVRCLGNGSVIFSSNQAAAQQQIISAVGMVVINTWQNIGISRSGTLVEIFKNGEESAYVAQPVIINPLTSARKVLVGVYDDETTYPWSQYMSRPRAWLNRQLTKGNHRFIWDTERNLYGV